MTYGSYISYRSSYSFISYRSSYSFLNPYKFRGESVRPVRPVRTCTRNPQANALEGADGIGVPDRTDPDGRS